LIGTEGFSIIQNLLLIGVPAPEFLQKVFGLMRDNAGKLVKIPPKSGDGI
jgi:phage-related holin